MMLAIVFATVVSQMGALTFPVTGNAQCKKHFTDGMLALHSFMYDRAHGEFVAAAKADAKCAMAHWGDAMSFNHPLWGEEDLAAARATLAEVKDEAHLTDKERAFLRAARVLFGDGDPKSRLRGWLAAATEMHQKFAGDDEVALEHALALIANSERLSDQKKLMQAAAIGMDVLARRPMHPGAAHYVIHSCDTPDHAILALPAAEKYAKIAPAASHALHMPSHIFVQLGMWERVARSNEVAWAASQKNSQGKSIDVYDWHSYSWLGSAYLELGQLERGKRLLDELADRIAHEDNADPRFAYSMIAHLYITNAEAWDRADEILKPIASHLPMEKGDQAGSLGCAQHAPGGGLATRYPVGLMSQVRAGYVRAEAAMRRGDELAVKNELAALKPIFEAIEAWHAMLGPTYYERRKATEAFFVAGAHAYKEKSPAAFDAAVAAAKKVIDAGDPLANGPAFDPPGEEWLGEIYTAAGKSKEALAAFDAALARHPRLSRALLGAARAAKAAGDEQTSHARYAELAGLWSDADADLPAVKEVRAAVHPEK
jgi:tetratricopeptide (TPR) repeat protein